MAKPTLFDAWQALVGDPLHNDPIEVDGVLVDRIHCVGEQTPPTDEEANTKLASMISEWESQEYARNREAEYPSIAELTIALYDTDDKAAIDAKRAAVKAKYPKPS